MRALLVAGCLVVGACSSTDTQPTSAPETTSTPETTSSPTTTTTTEIVTTTTPASRVVELEPIEAPGGVQAWNVSYVSETVRGEPTTVTGWIAIPDAAEEEIPVVAWAHPTVGLADTCSPSAGGGRTPFSFRTELDAGWAVVATDYEGLGGPGLHPYLVSESAARSIFDIVRAARELDDRVGDRVALWGFSQGGHAVLSAAGLAADLAPELEVVGTVAIAPAVDLVGWPPVALGTTQQGYIATIVVAYAETYGLDVREVLGPLDDRLLEEITSACADPTFLGAALLPADRVFSADPSQVEPWASLLRDNSPDLVPIPSPVLIVAGDEDRLFDTAELPALVERMCALGTPVATMTYPDVGHLDVQTPAARDIRVFLTQRIRGSTFESDC